MPTSEAIARATGKDIGQWRQYIEATGKDIGQWRQYIEATASKSVEELDHKSIAEQAVNGGASPW